MMVVWLNAIPAHANREQTELYIHLAKQVCKVKVRKKSALQAIYRKDLIF